MSYYSERSREEQKEILEIANFICDFNMQKGGVGDRYLSYAVEVAAALYDEGYRKAAPRKK